MMDHTFGVWLHCRRYSVAMGDERGLLRLVYWLNTRILIETQPDEDEEAWMYCDADDRRRLQHAYNRLVSQGIEALSRKRIPTVGLDGRIA